MLHLGLGGSLRKLQIKCLYLGGAKSTPKPFTSSVKPFSWKSSYLLPTKGVKFTTHSQIQPVPWKRKSWVLERKLFLRGLTWGPFLHLLTNRQGDEIAPWWSGGEWSERGSDHIMSPHGPWWLSQPFSWDKQQSHADSFLKCCEPQRESLSVELY